MKPLKTITEQKLQGAYYTPDEIALFIIKWGVNPKVQQPEILEPSCGDGVFLNQLKNLNLPFKSITAIELNPLEAEKANQIPLKNKQVINQDFYQYCNNTTQKFDLIIGNPPYIRYQYFGQAQQQETKKIFQKAALNYSKLTNAWVSFVIGSSLLLKDKGKLGFVVPAELLNVSYAQQLRDFLGSFFNQITLISFNKLVFPDIQQDVILLLCEKNELKTHFIHHIELHDLADLSTLDTTKLTSKLPIISNKWTYYFLTQEEIEFLERVKKKMLTIKHYANVEVGMTTGSNNYFTVDNFTVQSNNLAKFAKPMLPKCINVKGISFNKSDWLRNKKNNTKSQILLFSPESINDIDAKKYIEHGQKIGVHQNYKTRIRPNWFVLPSIKLSDGFFTRRNNLFPRLILNQAQSHTTDTNHRIFINNDINHKAFIASFYNSLSFAFSEIVGRNYGGGVLEILPSEAKNVILPYNANNDVLFDKIDQMFRKDIPIDEILQFTNQYILQKNYGLTEKEIKLAHSIWKKLSFRRLNKKAK